MNANELIPGKWYKIRIYSDTWILKFQRLDGETILTEKSASSHSNHYDTTDSRWGSLTNAKSVEFATREEILNYYPEEKLDQVINNYSIY